MGAHVGQQSGPRSGVAEVYDKNGSGSRDRSTVAVTMIIARWNQPTTVLYSLVDLYT